MGSGNLNWFTADGGGGRIRCLKLRQLTIKYVAAVMEAEWTMRKRREASVADTWSSSHGSCPPQGPVSQEEKLKLISDYFSSPSF